MSKQCEHPGWCADVQKHLDGRLWEIYSGQWVHAPLAEDQRQAYITRWRAQARWYLPIVHHWQRAHRFLCAHLRHFLAGLPTIDAAALAERERQCAACPNSNHHPDEGKRFCKLCGCGTEGLILNKLRMPLEQCPDKPPRWRRVDPTGWRGVLWRGLRPVLRVLSCG